MERSVPSPLARTEGIWQRAVGTIRSSCDSVSGESLSILKGHSDDIVMVAFNLDSSIIASASEDKTIRL